MVVGVGLAPADRHRARPRGLCRGPAGPGQHAQDAVSGQRGVGRGAQDPRRTPDSWRGEPLAYSDTDRISNGPTEAINLLIKKVKRVGHGLRNFDNYRLRLLLHWDVEWHTPDATCLSRPASPRRKCCANGDRPDRGSRIGSQDAVKLLELRRMACA